MNFYSRITIAAERLAIDGMRSPQIAIQRYEKTDQGNWLVYLKCPYCKRVHQHGAGDGDKPYEGGFRVQHCADEYARLMPEYELMPRGHDDAYDRAQAADTLKMLRQEVRRIEDEEREAEKAHARQMAAIIDSAQRGGKYASSTDYLSAIKALRGLK